MKKFFLKHMLSKQKDGRPTVGFGLVVVLILIPFIAVVVYFKAGDPLPSKVDKGIETPTLSKPISQGKEAEEEAKESMVTSERNMNQTPTSEGNSNASPTPGGPPSQPSLPPMNALDFAVQEAEMEAQKERPVVREDPTLPGLENEGAYTDPESPGGLLANTGPRGESGVQTQGGQGGGGNNLDIGALTVYRRKPKTEEAKPPVAESKYKPGSFIPRGEYIEVFILDTIRTDQPQPIITLGVAKDVIYKGKVLIPFGTKILATAGEGMGKGQRISINASSLQWLEDGTETGFSGVVKGIDGATGVPAYYIPPPMWSELSSYVNDFLAGYLNLLYTKQQNNMQLTVGNVAVGSSSTFNPKLEALATTSDVIQRFAQKQMEELQERYAPYLVVLPGTVARIQLTAPLDLTSRGVGIAESPVTPTFQGNASSGNPSLDMVQQVLSGMSNSKK